MDSNHQVSRLSARVPPVALQAGILLPADDKAVLPPNMYYITCISVDGVVSVVIVVSRQVSTDEQCDVYP